MKSPWISTLTFPGILKEESADFDGEIRDDFMEDGVMFEQDIKCWARVFTAEKRKCCVETGPGRLAPFRRGVLPDHARRPQRPGAEPPAEDPVPREGVRALCALDDANGRLDGGLRRGKTSNKTTSWRAAAVTPAGKGQAWEVNGQNLVTRGEGEGLKGKTRGGLRALDVIGY